MRRRSPSWPGSGVPSELGTDTAWTFEPHPPEVGRRALTDAGWDGRAPVLVVCPIHPFWWPVKAELGKFAANKFFGAYKAAHYRSVYFHNAGPTVDAAFAGYISGMARAVETFRQRHRAFVILVAMERLDARACEALAERMAAPPIFTSDRYNMYELVSVLRACDWMVSSRYHGIVTSMPGLVPSAGVTMDERIRNLLEERGHQDLLMNVDDPDLESRLLAAMEKLRTDADSIRDAMARTIVRNLERMAGMGVFLERNVQRIYPDFPIQGGVRSWEDYLPPLSPQLEKMVEQYANRPQAVGAR